ncbi:MAG: hypothetical protein ABI443_01160 [Chthoniobacterales bacterium]
MPSLLLFTFSERLDKGFFRVLATQQAKSDSCLEKNKDSLIDESLSKNQTSTTISKVNTKKAIEVINQLVADKVIAKYAIGGAVGALFYLEPTNTEDIDVFIHLEPIAGSLLVTIDPLLKKLEALGYSEWENDKIVIEGWPVQFLPAATLLEIDALESAIKHELEPGLITYALMPEFLMAIALACGRPKDKVRLEQFEHQNAYDPDTLHRILIKHSLDQKWENFKLSLKGE